MIYADNAATTKMCPAAIEAMPLTLEEVFLYEMEVKGYDAQVIFG